jgi:hypothetical protein
VLAIYKRSSCFGAVAKSNFVGLRFREAIYRNLRELVISYFEDFFNVHGEKTLRSYTLPLNLRAFDKLEWMWRDEGADAIERHLMGMRRIPLLTEPLIDSLSPVDQRAYEAGMLGANAAGLYEPAA